MRGFKRKDQEKLDSGGIQPNQGTLAPLGTPVQIRGYRGSGDVARDAAGEDREDRERSGGMTCGVVSVGVHLVICLRKEIVALRTSSLINKTVPLYRNTIHKLPILGSSRNCVKPERRELVVVEIRLF